MKTVIKNKTAPEHSPGTGFTVIGLAVIFAAAGLLATNIFFGMGQSDEPFYYAVPYRIMLGDAMFIDEWHASQLSGFLQYPLVRLFTAINGSGEGIMMFMRSAFVICQTAASCTVFLRMRRYGFISALVGALLFELYYPEYIPALNYYTLSMFPVLAASLLIIWSDKLSFKKLAFAGALFACSVVAEPVFAVVYALWFIAVIIFTVSKKHSHPLLTFRLFLSATAGIAVVAAAFFAFLFSQETPGQFFSALPNIFTSGEYSPHALFSGYKEYITSLFQSFSWFVAAPVIYIIIILIDKKRSGRKAIWTVVGFSTAAVCLIYPVITALINGEAAEFWHLPFIVAFLGISSYILLDNKDKRLLALWIAGSVFVLLLGVTSAAMALAGSYGFVLSDIASAPLIFRLLKELKSESLHDPSKKAKVRRQKRAPVILNRVSSLCLASVLVFVFGVYSKTILSHDPMKNTGLTSDVSDPVKIDKGAYKGIYLSQRQKDEYDSVYSDIQFIEERAEGSYTVCGVDCWYIFSSGNRPLTFTLWFDLSARGAYREYYRQKNELPEYVYIEKTSVHFASDSVFRDRMNEYMDSILDDFVSLFDCEVTDGKAGYILKVNGYNES